MGKMLIFLRQRLHIPNNKHACCGFTLIEILAVVVIMSMMFAITANALRFDASTAGDLHTVLNFEQKMRRAAQEYGPLTVSVHGMRMDVRGAAQDSVQGETFRRTLRLPVGLRFVDRGGRSLRAWNYDAQGRSIDFEIRSAAIISDISTRAYNRVAVFGLTGSYQFAGEKE